MLYFLFHHVAEIARQAAQIKLMRKLEKQAMVQAAKEARKQQGKQLLFSQILLYSRSYAVCKPNMFVFSSNNGC